MYKVMIADIDAFEPDALLALKRAKRLEQQVSGTLPLWLCYCGFHLIPTYYIPMVQADSYIGMIHSLENTKFNLESGSTSAEVRP